MKSIKYLLILTMIISSLVSAYAQEEEEDEGAFPETTESTPISPMTNGNPPVIMDESDSMSVPEVDDY